MASHPPQHDARLPGPSAHGAPEPLFPHRACDVWTLVDRDRDVVTARPGTGTAP
jgi:hypothetical protein